MNKFRLNILDKAYLGMGLSRYTGFEFMKCVNIDDYGVIKLNYKPYAQAEDDAAGGPITSLPLTLGYGRSSASAFIKFALGNGYIKFYSIGDSEWKNIAGASYPDSIGAGGFYAGSNSKDYLMYRNGANLHALDCSSTASPSITSNVATTLETGEYYSPFFTASNSVMYIGNRRYIASLEEVAGQTFAPGTGATFSFNPKKLDLPASYEISCLGEWSEYLVVGTKNPSNPYVSDIFLWDMVSPSYDRKISINAPGGINQIIVHKNYIFFQAGNFGEWFVTVGGAAEKVAEIPQQLLGKDGYVSNIHPNARAIKGDRIYFGCTATSMEKNLSGIWSFDTRLIGTTFDPTNKGVQACQYEYTISTGETSGSVTIGGMIPIGTSGGLNYGFYDGSTAGIDEIDATGSSRKVYSSSDGIIISQYFQLGGLYSNTLKSDLYLAKPLIANESIKIYIRNDVRYDCNTTTDWAVDSEYVIGNERVVEGRMYYCVASHTSTTSDKPGYGANWKTYWSASWKLYATVDSAGNMIYELNTIDSENTKGMQFKYVIDATDDYTGPELFQHILYD